MGMKVSELQEHRARFLQAYVNGHEIGLADEYVAKLEKLVTVTKGPRGSAEHLYALAEKALLKAMGGAPLEEVENAKAQALIVEEEVETDKTPVAPPAAEVVTVVENDVPPPVEEIKTEEASVVVAEEEKKEAAPAKKGSASSKKSGK